MDLSKKLLLNKRRKTCLNSEPWRQSGTVGSPEEANEVGLDRMMMMMMTMMMMVVVMILANEVGLDRSGVRRWGGVEVDGWDRDRGGEEAFFFFLMFF